MYNLEGNALVNFFKNIYFQLESVAVQTNNLLRLTNSLKFLGHQSWQMT